MDLNAAEMFVYVVQAGSLSAAAHRMDVPLPTLSRRIRELERELNVQLLERSTRGTRLTDAGTRFYEHANRGVEALAEGQLAVMSDQARLSGRLRLSIPPAFEPWWALLDAFQIEYPEIRLSIYTTERLVDLVEDGIDVALRVGMVVHEAMVAKRMLAYRHVLVAAPELLARLGMPKVPGDLHRFPCAAWYPERVSHRFWHLGDEAFEPKATLIANDYMQLRHMALSGHVVTELPPFLAANGIAQGLLQPLLSEYPFPEQTINLLYPSHRYPSSLVRAYIDFCHAHVSHYLRGTTP